MFCFFSKGLSGKSCILCQINANDMDRTKGNMTIEDVRNLVVNDEDKNLELKKSTGELKDGMHSACAFLNTQGGYLIFGVTPASLKIIGQEVTDNTKREIAHALVGLEPVPDVDVEYIDIPERPGFQLIVLHFEPYVWGDVPYTYYGRPYYRVESTTKIMPREMYHDRLRASNPRFFSWERLKASRIGIEDLNEQRVRGAVRLGVESGRMPSTAFTEPFEILLDKLELLTDGVPNNAAAALFGTNNYEYPQFRMRMARFRGTDKMEFIDNQRVDGNFFDLLDAGMAFFFKHLSLSGKIVGFYREEHLEVPSEALREALTNALCHRQLEKYNLTIGIAIYDDRIEIENPGILPPQLDLGAIRDSHISMPYNPIMADVLFKTTFLENWGTGLKRIVDACVKQNLPEPEWRMQQGFVVVTFRRPPYGAEPGTYPASTEQAGPKQGPSRAQAGPVYKPSSAYVEDVVKCIPDGNEYTLSEIMTFCAKRSKKKFRLNYLIPAIGDGAIDRKYPENHKHPYQKYRLTEKALSWKNGM